MWQQIVKKSGCWILAISYSTSDSGDRSLLILHQGSIIQYPVSSFIVDS
jgi:hypothetical protein